MTQLLSTLGLIFGSLLGGYIAQVLLLRSATEHGDPQRSAAARRAFTRRTAARLQRFAITFITPVVLASTFWTLSWGGGTLAFFPVLGVMSHLIGGCAALGIGRRMGLPRKAAGSLFTCGAFTNLHSFGGLAALMFYGEEGYALSALFRVFESAVYYGVGFPVARAFASQQADGARIQVDVLGALRDPLILRPVAAMVFGGCLNWSGVQRPEVLKTVTPALVMCSTVLMLLSVGLTLTVKAAPRYRRECLAVAGIKFLLLPAVLTLVALALGYARIQGGLPLKIVVTMSAMPVAFNSLIPPSLYGLDLDLASSCWLVTTAMLAAVLPLLYLVSLI